MANIISDFIRHSKSPADALIPFVRKKNSILCLFVDHRGFNDLTIKNSFPLSLISKSLNSLDYAKRFTQLDLTNAYHQIRIQIRWQMQNSLPKAVQLFRVPNPVLRFFQCPRQLLRLCQQNLAEKIDIFIILYLDDILIYTKHAGQGHVEAIKWVFG